MNVSILIVTFIKDVEWLQWCVRSIEKFASGFLEVVIAVPSHNPSVPFLKISNSYHGSVPLRLFTFDEWPGKGFVHHASLIVDSDLMCPKADFVLHLDSDCIFVEPVSPEDYFVDSKLILIGAKYDWIVKTFNNDQFYNWQEAVRLAVGWKPELEWMRRQPMIYMRQVYGETRAAILRHTGLNSQIYIRGTRNEFPQTFAEHPLLGEIEWLNFKGQFHFIDQEKDPFPNGKLYQFWSHQPIDSPNNVWKDGSMKEMIPIDVMKKLLG